MRINCAMLRAEWVHTMHASILTASFVFVCIFLCQVEVTNWNGRHISTLPNAQLCSYAMSILKEFLFCFVLFCSLLIYPGILFNDQHCSPTMPSHGRMYKQPGMDPYDKVLAAKSLSSNACVSLIHIQLWREGIIDVILLNFCSSPFGSWSTLTWVKNHNIITCNNLLPYSFN